MNQSLFGQRAQTLLFSTVAILFYLAIATPLPAATIITGDVTPPLPWSSSYPTTFARIGDIGSGTLTVDEGSTLASFSAYLGYSPGSTGTATITGTGSQWNNSYELHVGLDGSGTLTVADEGEVTAGTLLASLDDLYGNGTITAAGAVLDADLRFDAAHGTQQEFSFGTDGRLIVTPGQGGLGAGYHGVGSLTIADGVAITSDYGILGYRAGSTGSATITGAGSNWTANSDLFVGGYGSGILNVEDGATFGKFGIDSEASIGFGAGGTGVVSVTGAGSWFHSHYLYVGGNRFGEAGGNGIITITAGGRVDNFVDTYIGKWGSGAVMVSGPDSSLYPGQLLIGPDGSLKVENGGKVEARTVVVESPTVTVSGADSLLTSRSELNVYGVLTVEDGGEVTTPFILTKLNRLQGNGTIHATTGAILDADLRFDATHGIRQTFPFGSGGILTVDFDGGTVGIGYRQSNSLIVTDGMHLTSTGGFVGHDRGSGTASVIGPGSTWTNHGLLVGYYSTASSALHIRDGGVVETSGSWMPIGSTSLATIDVGHGSLLAVDNLTHTAELRNNGIVRILSDAGVPAGSQHTPIAVDRWTGTGIYQAVGGVWDGVNRVFTVSDTVLGDAGTWLAIDRSQHQRVLIVDPKLGWTVGASLLAGAGAVDFMAAPLAGPIGQTVLGAWEFNVAGDGYTAGDPLYLSFPVDMELTRAEVRAWHFDGTHWSPFDAPDLSLTGGYASFTVESLSGYALTQVPEPATLALMLAAIAAARLQRRVKHPAQWIC